MNRGAGTDKAELYGQFARVGKALASPARLQILDILAQGERRVDELARVVGLKLTTTSAHLQALRAGGLVSTRRDGTRIYYRLASDRVAGLFRELREVAAEQLADTERAARAFLGEDELEPVDREALLTRITRGVTLLDVRPAAEFGAGHIPGAVSVPLAELRDRLAELPAEPEVVAYCRGEFCVLAYEAVRLLRRAGRTARRLRGGMLEWRLEQRPVAS